MISTLNIIVRLIEKDVGLTDDEKNRISYETKLKEDLGLDSLDMAQILIDLETLFPKMDADVFYSEFRDTELTINDLVVFIEKNS